jgi:hypothetical protein
VSARRERCVARTGIRVGRPFPSACADDGDACRVGTGTRRPPHSATAGSGPVVCRRTVSHHLAASQHGGHPDVRRGRRTHRRSRRPQDHSRRPVSRRHDDAPRARGGHAAKTRQPLPGDAALRRARGRAVRAGLSVVAGARAVGAVESPAAGTDGDVDRWPGVARRLARAASATRAASQHSTVERPRRRTGPHQSITTSAKRRTCTPQGRCCFTARRVVRRFKGRRSTPCCSST